MNLESGRRTPVRSTKAFFTRRGERIEIDNQFLQEAPSTMQRTAKIGHDR